MEIREASALLVSLILEGIDGDHTVPFEHGSSRKESYHPLPDRDDVFGFGTLHDGEF
jgi:hypothetical protein